MKALTMTILLMGMGLLSTAQVLAGDSCSTRAIAGSWVFATGVGRQMLGFPPGKDITAIGTMNIAKDGSVSGEFDTTIQDEMFFSDIAYAGTVDVNADCTGTLTFETIFGARTDSIVVVDRREMLGMSQDPFNLFTYQVRRISSNDDGDNDD